MTINPIVLRNNLLIKPFPPKDKINGIFIPETAQKRNCKASIIAVGKGSKEFPMRFSEGQTIFHIKDCGDEILIDNERYFILADRDVLAYNEN